MADSISAKVPADDPLRIFASLLAALLLFLPASGHVLMRDCSLCGLLVTKAPSLLPVACATLGSLLCAYAAGVAIRNRKQARSVNRLLECQSLLGRFAHAFDDALTRSEFSVEAAKVLTEFAHHFGANAVRLEIVEPRTGVTVEEFLGTTCPPPVEANMKAAFLATVGAKQEDGEPVTTHFIDLARMHGKSTKSRKTARIAAAVTTPLGRIGILRLDYGKPRRAFDEDEIRLLCTSLSGLIQAGADHCKRRNREDLQRRLNHAERIQAVGTLAGGIAHEFNNILGALLGYGEMALQRAEEGAGVEHYLHEMMRTAHRAEFIVNQILTLSRSREQERRPINLVDAIRDALPLIAASLAKLEVHAPLPSDEDCKILGHPVELQQILMNLCKNACEASRGEIRVEIAVDVVTIDEARSLLLGLLQPGRYARILVSDNGMGISPDALPHIFEPFFTTRAATGGTGLGLAAVHGLVTAMDGRVDVTSRLEHGTCFEVYFPHSSLSPVPIDQFFTVPNLLMGDGQLIALLEPHCRDLAMHEEKIAALGYEPVGFVEIGLLEDWLFAQTPDLIMIDMRSIPTGLSARDIQAMARGAPVVLISHGGKEAILSTAFALHFTILREPLTSRALADAIKGSIAKAERPSTRRNALPARVEG